MPQSAVYDLGLHCLPMYHQRRTWTLILVSSIYFRTINEDPDQSKLVCWLNWILVSSIYFRTINEDPDQSKLVCWLNWILVSSIYFRTINEDPGLTSQHQCAGTTGSKYQVSTFIPST